MSTAVWLVVVSSAVLCWTWVVYPAAIWLFSRAFPSGVITTLADWPHVTAILATRDDLESIVARIDDFLLADYPAERLTVVVAVDRAEEEYVSAVRSRCADRAVRIVPADPEGGKCAGLNAAVRDASGEIVVFSDSQQRFETDAIRVMVSRLVADRRLGAVGGSLQLPGDRPGAGGRSPVEWYWFMERHLREAEARVHSTVGLSGSIYAMWRRDWLPMPPHLILDDVWLPMQLVLTKRRVGFELRARAWDARGTSASQEKTRKVRTLTGNFQLVAWLPAVLVPWRNPLFVQFASHKVLRLFTPWLLTILLAGGATVALRSFSSTAIGFACLTVAALIALVSTMPRRRAVVLRTMDWVWSMQTAIFEATMNGIRGRWNVWR